jgi:hypothetical protein
MGRKPRVEIEGGLYQVITRGNNRTSLVAAKERLILVGRRAGASVKQLSEITGISGASVSRRYDAERRKVRENQEISKLAAQIESRYWRGDN